MNLNPKGTKIHTVSPIVLENPGIEEYGPLLYKIASSFGFSNNESDDLLAQINLSANRHYADHDSITLRIWLSKMMVRKCIFKISNRLFSQNSSLEIKPRVLGYSSVYTNSPCSVVRDMPLGIRAVYILKSIIGFDEIEIAEILNTTSISVKDKFQKAKSFINTC